MSKQTERLNACIVSSGESCAEIARAAGLSKTTISDLWNGKKGYGQDSLMKLARHFGVNPEWLCGESNTRTGFGGR